MKVCDEIIELAFTKNYATDAKVISRRYIQKEDIVVLDGYHFNTDYQTIVRKNCFKLISIDDLHSTHFVADVVINHSEGIRKQEYSTAFYTRLYLGTSFSILRPSFLKKQLPAPVSDQRVFINMGGTDQKNYTEKALKNCLKSVNPKRIDVVVGSFYPYTEKIKKIALENKQLSIHLHSNLTEKEIAALIKKSTLGICSASTISYEYANIGGLLYVYQTVPNQKNIYRFLIKSGVAFAAKTLSNSINSFNDTQKRAQYFKQRRSYFDGQSGKNIQAIFAELEMERTLKFRLASAKDALIYFKWANDPEVRGNAIHTEPIPLENHLKWFDSKLKNNQAALYLFTKNDKPIGQVRFDKTENKTIIDYSVDKQYRGKGLGKLILKQALIDYKSKYPSTVIHATVKASNEASNKIFRNLQFKETKASYHGKISFKNYSLAAG
jgi:spore coat polysaccharide biosynthesis predicted glycosyltransferase SpsG/L-amino acid N-acyltransferase YncA